MERYITDIVEFTGKRPELFEGMKKYISTGALILSNIDNNAVELIEYYSRPSRADLEVKPGDLVFAKMSNTDKRLIINEETSKYIYSTGFFAVKTKQGVITTKCLYYLLGSKNFLDQKDKNSTGATQRAITIDGLSKIKVRIPDYISQKNIEIILELLDEIVKLRKNQINEYDQLIKSRFVEMFGQDLKGKSIRLGDLAEVITKGTTPTTLGYDFVDDGVNFIKVECITETGKFIKEKMLHINEECNEKLKRSKLKKDDILFSIAGAIGRTAIVTDDILPANTNQALSIIRLRKDVGLNVEFLNQVFKTDLVAEQIEKRINGVAQMNVSLADIGNLKIIRPTIERQNEFASFVKQVDKLKFENEILYSIYRFTINKQTKLLGYRGVTL